jgi:hypothetical protein
VSETAAANGFNTLMRSLGTSIGAAVIGVVLSQMTVTMGGFTFASEDGFRAGLLIGGGVALLAAAVAATIPGVARSAAAQDGEAENAVTAESAAKA